MSNFEHSLNIALGIKNLISEAGSGWSGEVSIETDPDTGEMYKIDPDTGERKEIRSTQPFGNKMTSPYKPYHQMTQMPAPADSSDESDGPISLDELVDSLRRSYPDRSESWLKDKALRAISSRRGPRRR